MLTKKIVSIAQTKTDLRNISFCNKLEKSGLLVFFASALVLDSFSNSSSSTLNVNNLASLPYYSMRS